LNIKEFGYNIVNIEVTNRCNMRCTFCALPIRQVPDKEMESRDVYRIIEELAGYQGIDFIAFHQFGEPILHKDIWSYVDKCKELGLKTQFVTNGLALTKKNIERLIEHSPSIVRISLHVLDPENHEENRGIKVPYETYIQRVSDCIAALLDDKHSIEEVRIDVAVNDDRNRGIKKYILGLIGAIDVGDPTIKNQNVRKLRPLLVNLIQLVEKKSKSFKFSMDHFDEHIKNYYISNRVGAGFHDVAYIFKKNIFLAYKSFWNGRKLVDFYPVSYHSICKTGTIGILADGTVTMCCNDYEGFTGLGNISNDSLESILNRNRSIIFGLKEKGDLYFEACKKCLGAPTRKGAILKEGWFHLKKILNKSN
jgi:MoaA/NifB/PqqE/SkfB family radical SAM enzyme